MATKGMTMCVIFGLVVMQWDGAAAQTSCTNALMSMSPCLTFVTGNSSTPTTQCCSKLFSVVQSQPQCICSLIKTGVSGAAALGITVNQTLALTLPTICNVQMPPVNQLCSGTHTKYYHHALYKCIHLYIKRH